MDRLCASTQARLTAPMRKDVESAFADLQEEHAQKLQVMKATVNKLFSDIESLEEDKKLLHQQSVIEKEKFRTEMEAFCKAEQRKSQATIEELSATFKEANVERVKEMERMEANFQTLMSRMKQDHEEKEMSTNMINEALVKEIENHVASWNEEVQKINEEYEAAVHNINLQLKEKKEQLPRLENGRSKFLAAIDMITKEKENLTLSGAMNTAIAKQRLVSELRAHAETWVFGNASSRPPVVGHVNENIPKVFLRWKIRDDWRKLQGNQAFLNDDLQTFALSKEIEAKIQQVIAAEDKLQKLQKLQKFRNEAQKREAKLAQAKLKELAKLDKKRREIIEKMQKAEQKEAKRRQLKEKKQREENEKKEAREQKKAEAMRQREAKRAERDGRLQEDSPGVWRRFFRACFYVKTNTFASSLHHS